MAVSQLIEQGVITSIDASHIHVRCLSKVDCIRCEQGNGCGGGILARWLGDRQYQIKIPYASDQFLPRVNSIAAFSLPASFIVKIAAFIYGLPLLLVTILLVILNSLVLNEGVVMLLTVGVFFSALCIVKKLLNRYIARGEFAPKLMKIVDSKQEIACAISDINVKTQ